MFWPIASPKYKELTLMTLTSDTTVKYHVYSKLLFIFYKNRWSWLKCAIDRYLTYMDAAKIHEMYHESSPCWTNSSDMPLD